MVFLIPRQTRALDPSASVSQSLHVSIRNANCLAMPDATGANRGWHQNARHSRREPLTKPNGEPGRALTIRQVTSGAYRPGRKQPEVEPRRAKPGRPSASLAALPDDLSGVRLSGGVITPEPGEDGRHVELVFGAVEHEVMLGVFRGWQPVQASAAGLECLTGPRVTRARVASRGL